MSRLGVYCDFSYRTVDGVVSAELPFIRFLEGLAPHFERLVLFGRQDPGTEPFPYRLAHGELVALPFYGSGAEMSGVLRSVPGAVRAFWRALGGLDTVWILGPNPPQALLFALLGVVRGRRVVLGVRQNLPELIRHRRPDQPLVQLAARLLEAAFRRLARRLPVVVVGPDLARRYGRSRALLDTYVSLLRESDLVRADDARPAYEGEELVILSVGRLDPEKNPRLLADVLARALESDPRWRLEVCGDGPMADALTARARELGVQERLRQHGYVPIDRGLWDFYRSAHALLHISMTEGVPQVLLEAFAARLPVVATDVGGVGALLRGRGLLVAPEDPEAAAVALTRIAGDAGLREKLVEAAQRTAEAHTLEAECARVAGFLSTNS